MTRREGIVIVGGGQAGLQLAASARASGYGEPIRIVCTEADLPYQRPPLSKAYLLGKQPREQLVLQKEPFFGTHRIDLLSACTATAIDRHGCTVELDDGSRLGFDRLVIATGARNRTLSVPGHDLEGVSGLRDLKDADRLAEALLAAERIVVIGGGFIGLEFAAVARQLGKAVLVLEAQTRLMARAVPESVSRFFLMRHEERGVRFALGASGRRLVGDGGRVIGVELEDGRTEPTDLVLVGIGVSANEELAAKAGLTVQNGVVVDDTLATSDPRILAIGDCASFPAPSGNLHRLESVRNAIDQAKHAVGTLTGKRESYRALPWFWSDQFEFKLQIAGLTAGADRTVTRGDPESGKFSVFSFRNGVLLGVDSVNRPLDHALARKLLAAPCHLSPDQAGDSGFDLRQLGRAEAS